MAIETRCQTPGVIFRTRFRPTLISIDLDLPSELDITPAEFSVLEANLHNALELVLARYFPQAEA